MSETISGVFRPRRTARDSMISSSTVTGIVSA